ncbi:hypothetical protein J3Q64DRAFT_1746627 [Phycomyces blakesleeanus]|uniref:F-box domain-containing protein n=2 Tax=Phycomyces blakesleeanus TaxID=4837 RepID=A0A167MAG3_PHYB8|nr:hypothetical protein PHYBLDRAFT_65671 [Phycomyces blakesleeanus NRRL 1555(-)]OAD72284.1 hypothetical protein PHYBLDRAFT_65671 [Phycomyces blakesleeanus NRRL 1555(-)]|eukprot:XP_018290324.1 hypothetical protein PHYBLDRAFT_65671 [Phycomyces blakesleeanus NRRL 1555(-)]
MLPSDLPFEILIIIANLVSLKDKSLCSRICKSWRAPFQESMLKDVVIHTKEELDAICDMSTKNPRIYQKNGQHVRHLFLYENSHPTDQHIQILQQHFPYLQHLHIKGEHFSSTTFGTAVNWNLWSSLRELWIGMETLVTENSEKMFLDIISCLPQLRRLELARHSWYTKMWFTLNDFETLHKNLPRLEHLALGLDMNELTTKDLVRISSTPPVSNLSYFDIDTKIMDYRWIAYFAHKYPKLHTLHWRTDGSGMARMKYQKEAASLFKSIPNAFKYLRTLRMKSERSQDEENLSFWEIFCPSTILVKSIKWQPYIFYDRPDIIERIIKTCMHSFSETLEILSIECLFNLDHPFLIRNAFIHHCPRLVDLNIHHCNASIELDTLLDVFPALGKLRLFGGRISVSPQASEKISISKRQLRSIEVHQATVSSATLEFISSCSRRLDNLHLSSTKVTGSISQKTGRLCIDMSRTRFENLYLGHVRFSTSEDEENEDHNLNLMILARSAVDIMKIKDNNNNPDDPMMLDNDSSNTDSNNNISDSSSSSSGSSSNNSSKETKSNTVKYTWIYTSHEKARNQWWTSNTHKLTKAQANRAHQYFCDFERERYLAMQRGPRSDDKEERTLENWTKHLYHGFTTLKCGYIEKYTIGS